jgi:hypothetical protein
MISRASAPRMAYGVWLGIGTAVMVLTWNTWWATADMRAADGVAAAGAAVYQPAPAGTKFVFDVIESYDAKYQGDTPGHIGRHGGLGKTRPQVILGDPVHRGAEQVGRVTGVTWDRATSSLIVEFDPTNGFTRSLQVAVGDEVWLYLTPPDGQRK